MRLVVTEASGTVADKGRAMIRLIQALNPRQGAAWRSYLALCAQLGHSPQPLTTEGIAGIVGERLRANRLSAASVATFFTNLVEAARIQGYDVSGVDEAMLRKVAAALVIAAPAPPPKKAAPIGSANALRIMRYLTEPRESDTRTEEQRLDDLSLAVAIGVGALFGARACEVVQVLVKDLQLVDGFGVDRFFTLTKLLSKTNKRTLVPIVVMSGSPVDGFFDTFVDTLGRLSVASSYVPYDVDCEQVLCRRFAAPASARGVASVWTTNALRTRLREAAALTFGITAEAAMALTPHGLRTGMVTEQSAAGATVDDLNRIGGWGSAHAAAGYDMRSAQAVYTQRRRATAAAGTGSPEPDPALTARGRRLR